jgi:catalase
MAFAAPAGPANYEPNSLDPAAGGPREDPVAGFRSYQEEVLGGKRRLRPDSFADHYSQAKLFYLSQAPVERRHIAEAFTFELSKVGRPAIRERMVAGLRNVDEDLAAAVGEGLGLRELPAAAQPAVYPRTDLGTSPALSIAARGPSSFAGRKLGVLVSAGADAAVLAGLRSAALAEGASVEVVGPVVGGVDASDGTIIAVDQQVDGAPSVLYDAVAVIAAVDGALALATRPAARDFLSDAYAHCKFIGHTDGAGPLLAAAGLDPGDGNVRRDDGIVSLDAVPGADFVAMCRSLRYWDRARVPAS